MRLRLLTLLAWLILWPGVILGPATSAAAGNGCISAGWEVVDASCTWTYGGYVSASSSDDYQWELSPHCLNGGIKCSEFQPCEEEGVAGTWHDVLRDGVDVGNVCVPGTPVQGPSREEILKKFKELQWPGSVLVIEPKGGKTLVNLETIFYTTNKEPTKKTVRIANTDVQIIATPVSYTWSFGDGATLVTADAGRPHPHRDVFHVYETTDEVRASVATTYSGDYKIGDDPWETLDETLTVPGPEVALEVLEAKPQLVLE